MHIIYFKLMLKMLSKLIYQLIIYLYFKRNFNLQWVMLIVLKLLKQLIVYKLIKILYIKKVY